MQFAEFLYRLMKAEFLLKLDLAGSVVKIHHFPYDVNICQVVDSSLMKSFKYISDGLMISF